MIAENAWVEDSVYSTTNKHFLVTHLVPKRVQHHGVEADDQDEGQEVAQHEEAPLQHSCM